MSDDPKWLLMVFIDGQMRDVTFYDDEELLSYIVNNPSRTLGKLYRLVETAYEVEPAKLRIKE